MGRREYGKECYTNEMEVDHALSQIDNAPKIYNLLCFISLKDK